MPVSQAAIVEVTLRYKVTGTEPTGVVLDAILDQLSSLDSITLARTDPGARGGEVGSYVKKPHIGPIAIQPA